MDTHGRVFYIDHNTRTTTWQRPTSTVTDDSSVDEHRRQLDRRFHFHFCPTASGHGLVYLVVAQSSSR